MKVKSTIGGRLLALACVAFAASLLSPGVVAQNPTTPLVFDVASVKRSADPALSRVGRYTAGIAEPGGRWIVSEATLRDMIRAAYPEYALPGQVVGGPSWIEIDRFDVEAKTDPNRTAAEMLQMSRALLTERFGLTLRSEMRELPVYFLERERPDGPLGAGLRPPEINCDDYRAARARGEPIPKELYRYGDRLPCAAITQTRTPGRGRLTAGGTSIRGIMGLLSGQIGRPVIDRTGLAEVFDVELIYRRGVPETADSPGADLPALVDAVREQWGLRLQAGRAPINVLVVDSVHELSPN